MRDLGLQLVAVIDERAKQHPEQHERDCPAQIAPDGQAEVLALPVPDADQREPHERA